MSAVTKAEAEKNKKAQAIDKLVDNAGEKQVLILVSEQKETIKTAIKLHGLTARSHELTKLLRKAYHDTASGETQKLKTRRLKDLLKDGFAFHHKGLPTTDRMLIESLYEAGHIHVLVSTAWGVELPSQPVVVKGTQVVWDELPKTLLERLGKAEIERKAENERTAALIKELSSKMGQSSARSAQQKEQVAALQGARAEMDNNMNAIIQKYKDDFRENALDQNTKLQELRDNAQEAVDQTKKLHELMDKSQKADERVKDTADKCVKGIVEEIQDLKDRAREADERIRAHRDRARRELDDMLTEPDDAQARCRLLRELGDVQAALERLCARSDDTVAGESAPGRATAASAEAAMEVRSSKSARAAEARTPPPAAKRLRAASTPEEGTPGAAASRPSPAAGSPASP